MSKSKGQFIKEISVVAIRCAKKYGFGFPSVVTAQAILESGWGTSPKAAHHNYFGLKYREGRVSCNSGYFQDGGSEQRADGSYEPIKTDWYAFENLEKGVEGYFQFIAKGPYVSVRKAKTAREYLEQLKACSYATSIDYVQNVWRVVEQNDLTSYDEKKGVSSIMGYTNSALVNYTKLSPNHSGQRTHKIDRITPHCVVGQLSAESIAACFPSGRGASCNYGVGYDGRISLICEEKNRSWCTSSNANDQRAITIEVASDKTEPYAFTNEAYKSLERLCIDICKRNGLKKVLWFGDKNKSLNYEPKDGECVLTVHRWFANKSCPGNWMYARMGQLADAINKALGNIESVGTIEAPTAGDKQNLYRVQVGAYKQKSNADAMLAKIKGKGFDAFVTQVGELYKVQVGAYSVKANADAQLKKIKAAGFDAFITQVSKASESFTPRKSAEEIAREVWTGKCSDSRWDSWGNGATRKERLEAAGYNYDAVQQAIKKLYK